jgi:hypothetical protein
MLHRVDQVPEEHDVVVQMLFIQVSLEAWQALLTTIEVPAMKRQTVTADHGIIITPCRGC